MICSTERKGDTKSVWGRKGEVFYGRMTVAIRLKHLPNENRFLFSLVADQGILTDSAQSCPHTTLFPNFKV